jgi:putative ABC transport system permease protein
MGTNLIVVTSQQSRGVGGRARTGSYVTTLNASDLKAILQSVDAISAFSPTVASVFRVRAGDLTKNTTIVGCAPGYFPIQNWSLIRGDSFDAAADRRQARVALLGSTTARDLFGEADPTGSRITMNRAPFTVAGVLAERGQGLDAANQDDQIYVPLQTAMHRLMNVDYFSSILFDVADASRLQDTADRIHLLLAPRHRHASASDDDFLVENRKSLIDTQLAAFARLTFLVRWIALSALVVSSLGVFAVTWIGIRNRAREIGTRPAVGANRVDILIQFFAEGTLGAALGCGCGTVGAYFALSIIDRALHQPFLFSFRLAFGVAAALMVLYSLFTFESSVRAIRIEPLAALRSE